MMGRVSIRALGLLVLLLWGVGCTGGGTSVPDEIGEACTDLGEAYCGRAVGCGLVAGDEELSCVNSFVTSCCIDDGTCNSPVDPGITSSEYNGCLDDVDTLMCTDVEQGNLPSACLSL